MKKKMLSLFTAFFIFSTIFGGTMVNLAYAQEGYKNGQETPAIFAENNENFYENTNEALDTNETLNTNETVNAKEEEKEEEGEGTVTPQGTIAPEEGKITPEATATPEEGEITPEPITTPEEERIIPEETIEAGETTSEIIEEPEATPEPRVDFTLEELQIPFGTLEVDLLLGGSATDENGNPLPLALKDDGGFTATLIGDYTLTYMAVHPILGEVEKTRLVSVLAGELVFNPAPTLISQMHIIAWAFEKDPAANPLPKWEQPIGEQLMIPGYQQVELVDELTGVTYFTLQPLENMATTLALGDGFQSVEANAPGDLENYFASAPQNLRIVLKYAVTGPINLTTGAGDYSLVIDGESNLTLDGADFAFTNTGSGTIGFQNITMNNSTITLNDTGNYDISGAIFGNLTGKTAIAAGGASLHITGSTLQTIENGNGITSTGTLNVAGTAFTGFTQSIGISVGGPLSITNSSFGDFIGDSPQNGKTALVTTGTATVTNTNFDGFTNTTGISAGGTISITDGNLTNFANSNKKTAFVATGTVMVTNTSFTDIAGRGIDIAKDTNLTLNNCLLNNISNLGGGHGAGVYMAGTNITFTAENTTFSNITGQQAGYAGAAITGFGITNTTMNITNCAFVDNTTLKYGAAISTYAAGSGTVINVKSSYFNNNAATEASGNGDGGAIGIFESSASNHATLLLNVDNCSFVNNKAADDGAAIFVQGRAGGFAEPVTKLTVKNSTFYGNIAQGFDGNGLGGAVQLALSATGAFTHNTFYKNTHIASNGGNSIGVHYSGSLWPRTIVYNNLFVGEKNISIMVDKGNGGNVGYDDGATLSPNLTAENIFTTGSLANNAGSAGAEIDGTSYKYPIPTLAIKAHTGAYKTDNPGAFADGAGDAANGLSSDQRGIDRGNPPAAGATEPFARLTYHLNTGGSETVKEDLVQIKLPTLPQLTVKGIDSSDFSAWSVPTDETFLGWSENQTPVEGETLYKANGLYTLEADTNLYARWGSVLHTLTYHYNDGNGATAEVKAGADGNTVIKTLDEADTTWSMPGDKAFKGWAKTPAMVDGETLYQPRITYTLTADDDLYARWVNLYTVIFDSQGGTSVNTLTGVEEGSTIKAPANPTKTDYIFAGWYKEKETQTPWNFATDEVTSNITLYAKWNPLYTLTYHYNDGKGATATDKAGADGKGVIKTLGQADATWNVMAGKAFKGWAETPSKVAGEILHQPGEGYTLVEDSNLYARWANLYTVIFDSQGGTSVNTFTGIEEGKVISLPTAPTKIDYVFAGWYKESGAQTPWNFAKDKVMGDITLYAKWTAKATPLPSASPTTSPTIQPTPSPQPLGRVVVTVVDEEDQSLVLPGTRFDMVQNGQILFTNLVADGNGGFEIDNLPLGSYELKQTYALANYLASGIITFEVGVNPSNNHTTYVTVTNKKAPINGSLVINKVDSADYTLALPGATFNLYRQGALVKQNLVTDINGQIYLTDLPWGSYTLEEIKAPEGYRATAGTRGVQITPNQTTTLRVTNRRLTGVPKAGDENNLPLYIGLMAGALVLIGLLIFIAAKKKKKQPEK